jgi:hypothetical protein
VCGGGLKLIKLRLRFCWMNSNAFTKVSAERLRLRAKLWRRDAENTTNRDLSQLMLHSAYELEEEAAGAGTPRRSASAPVMGCVKAVILGPISKSGSTLVSARPTAANERAGKARWKGRSTAQ